MIEGGEVFLARLPARGCSVGSHLLGVPAGAARPARALAQHAAAVLDLAVSGRGAEAKQQTETPAFQDMRRKLTETLTDAATVAA